MALFKKAPAATGAKKKSDAPIFVASDVVDGSGQTLFTRETVVDAINGFAKGKDLEKQGQALMETHKPAIAEFARQRFCALWAQQGSLPKTPKITTNSNGTGTMITVANVDRPSNLNDDQYQALVDCLGAEHAADAVDRYTQYSIDAKMASQEVTIAGTKSTVQEHIEKALMAYFPEDKHELLGEMLKPKEVFQTKKGLLPRLLDMVGRNSPKAAVKLADAMVKARVITAYKPGAVGDED